MKLYKRILPLWLCIIAFCCLGNSTFAQSNEVKNANSYYSQDKFEEAAIAYEKILKDFGASAQIYYNLGNAYYKTGKYEFAILNYERALKLNTDEDVQYNLKLANMQCVDNIEPVPQVFYQKWWQQLMQQSNADVSAAWMIAALFGFSILLLLFLMLQKPMIKRICFFSAGALLVFAALQYTLANRQNAYMQNNKAAILMKVSDYVKSSPDTKSANLFMLHAGTKVTVLDSLNGWHKIKIANGHVGWIDSKAIEII
ncbi:MAG: tetratricopeptide repeat protein [Bacteroidia bacterium]|nr:tetratricopeptide repeat protein [Bacteroidia bacterium]HQU99864.1 tetratricopeptide repeat protein [Bacteroidia bacterium]